jgi:tetratricopeptide (TPR) repeat protein
LPFSNTRQKKVPDTQAHELIKIAASCFNKAWDYLEKTDRNASEERSMLNLAHASRYLWGLVGSPRNEAMGDWQFSRAYSAVREPELALSYAKSCLETCEKNKISDLLASAYEGIARAYLSARDRETGLEFVRKARTELEASSSSSSSIDQEDGEIYRQQIDETESRLIDIT